MVLLKCSICGDEIKPSLTDPEGYGYNPAPILTSEDDRCCISCDKSVVLKRRFNDIKFRNSIIE